jgi:hypothetical protein
MDITNIENTKNIKLRIVKTTFVLLALFSLSSCATYGREFQCKEGKGLGCTSSSKIIELIEEDKIDEAIEQNNPGDAKKSKNNINKKAVGCKDCEMAEGGLDLFNGEPLHTINNASMQKYMKDIGMAGTKQSVTRSDERVIRVWFNEYVDGAGNFNGEQIVYTVIEPGKWVKR